MALSLVKPYFRDVFSGLDGGPFKEWSDAFNINNIPSNIYDKAYHLQFGSIDDAGVGNQAQQITCNFIVRIFFKGYRDVSKGVDTAVSIAEDVISAAQDPDDRSGTTIKNVKFLSMDISESFPSNDNLIVVTQNYAVTLFLCLGG